MNASSRFAAPRASISFCGASQASTLPAFMSEIRSQRIPSFMKCVVTKIVTPCLRERSIKSSQKLSFPFHPLLELHELDVEFGELALVLLARRRLARVVLASSGLGVRHGLR